VTQLTKSTSQQGPSLGNGEIKAPSTLELAILENDSSLLRSIILNFDPAKSSPIDFACAMVDPQTFNKNVFHIIAEYQNPELFTILTDEGRKVVSLAKVKRYLNQGVNDLKFLTPLFFCFPCQPLAEMYLKYGAEGSNLNIAQCYNKYKSDLEYLDFAIANFNMILTDLDEKKRPAL
jgi:hypothetical protein